MAQERIDDWWEYARELAKAERELKIEQWVFISIEYKDVNGHAHHLHSYDRPRLVKIKIQNQKNKEEITLDKNLGFPLLSFNSTAYTITQIPFCAGVLCWEPLSPCNSGTKCIPYKYPYLPVPASLSTCF